MDTVATYPWLEIFSGSTIILGLVAGFNAIISKYPASRYLGLLIFSLLFTMAAGIFLPPYVWMGVILASASVYLFSRGFLTQNSRISFWNMVPVTIVFALIWYDYPLVAKFSAVVFYFLYATLSISFISKELKIKGTFIFQNPGQKLTWYRNFLALTFLTLICWILKPELSVVDLTAFTFGLILFIFYQVFRESSFLHPLPQGTKYQKSTLSASIKSSILTKLEKVMVEEKFYRQDSASLGSLAKTLGASTHHLSQVLNESKQMSFQDLITKYRIREACQLLRKDGTNTIKIENIASQVGYNSKSAFNTAFKKKMGVTPSEFRDKKHVQTYREELLPDQSNTYSPSHPLSLISDYLLKLKNEMLANFFKVFFRNLQRNRIFSLINLFGLTMGFVCSILIYLFISDEQSYDKGFPDYDRIYRIASYSENPQTRTPHPMAQAMVQDFPEVEAAVSLSPWYGPGLSRDDVRVKVRETNEIFDEPNFFFADSTFFDVFDLEFVEGDERALYKPGTLVITQELARKYFGDESAVGKELELVDMPISISAVVKGMPRNTHFHFNAIIPYMTLKQINPNDDWMTWADFGHFNYLKTKEDVNSETLENKIPEWILQYLDWSPENYARLADGSIRLALQPITDIHLTSHIRWELENNGNVLYVYILSGTLAFIMLIVVINYVNLTTAKSMERAREIGVRKTLGAISSNLSFQFYLESIVFCLSAMLIALVASYLFLDGFNFLTGKEFKIDSIFNVTFLLKSVLLSIGIGLIAGIYPAFALSSFKPSEVLKGKLSTSSKGIRVRSILVVVQFVVSAILIAGSIIILKQINYMKTKELGFDQEAVISFNIPTSVEFGGIDISKTQAMKNRIESIPGVRKTTTISNLPGGQFNQHSFYAQEDPDSRIDMSEMMVSYDVEEVFNFEIIAGRKFDNTYAQDSAGRNWIVNEAAIDQLNLKNPIGKKLIWLDNENAWEGTIIGVVKDFHYRSLHESIQPLMIQLSPYDVGHLAIKLEGNQFQSALREIQAIFEENHTEIPFEYQFLDEKLSNLYDNEQKTLSIFAVFAAVALILAALGLLGMAIAMLNQRVKEVGLRKILGATIGQIIKMILGQFVRLIGIALFIGLPLSALIMQRWIEEFSYQANFGIMPFLLSGGILLIVAITSVISAVVKIAFANPIEALRYE